MDNEKLKYLINKSEKNQASFEEIEELEYWYAVYENRKATHQLNEVERKLKHKRIWNRTKDDPQLAPLFLTPKKLHQSSLFWAAATITIIFGTIAYLTLFQYKRATPNSSKFANIEDIKPASQNANLILADGSIIDLTELQEGMSVEQSGLSITKTPNGILTQSSLSNSQNSSQINTIKTPRGGHYNVVLPDGTRVWLNAESSLSYPSKFSKSERIVTLNGEAYFEVAAKSSTNNLSSDKTPFIVKTDHQEIEVLGTQFNVKSYNDENQTTTTLLEGKVKVTGLNNNNSQERILEVGEEAVWKNNQLNITKVNTNKAVDWKDGRFIFSGDNIKTIMTNVSRWYNIDVSYQGDVSNINFEGSMSRYETIGEVLRKLELTGTVQFKVIDAKKSNDRERRIIVMP